MAVSIENERAIDYNIKQDSIKKISRNHSKYATELLSESAEKIRGVAVMEKVKIAISAIFFFFSSFFSQIAKQIEDRSSKDRPEGEGTNNDRNSKTKKAVSFVLAIVVFSTLSMCFAAFGEGVLNDSNLPSDCGAKKTEYDRYLDLYNIVENEYLSNRATNTNGTLDFPESCQNEIDKIIIEKDASESIEQEIQCYRNLLKIEPDHLGAKLRLADALVDQAIVLFYAKDFANCNPKFAEASDIYMSLTQYDHPWVSYADCLYRAGQANEYLSQTDNAITPNSNHIGEYKNYHEQIALICFELALEENAREEGKLYGEYTNLMAATMYHRIGKHHLDELIWMKIAKERYSDALKDDLDDESRERCIRELEDVEDILGRAEPKEN